MGRLHSSRHCGLGMSRLVNRKFRSYNHLVPDGNQDDKKLEFYDERSSVTLYKQKRKRRSIPLELLGKNSDVAAENDLSQSKEQNIAR